MPEIEGRPVSPATSTQQNAPKYYPLKRVQIKKQRDISTVLSKGIKCQALNKKKKFSYCPWRKDFNRILTLFFIPWTLFRKIFMHTSNLIKGLLTDKLIVF